MMFCGTYGSTIYRDIKTGRSAFTIQSTENIPYRNAYGSINCYGIIPPLNKGMPIQVTGEWEQNKQKKYYLHISDIKISIDDRDTMVEYLQDSAFIGIGQTIAKNILDFTGTNILDFVRIHEDAEEQITNNIKGITQERVHNMIIQLKANSQKQDIYQYINKVGGDFENVDRLYESFAETSISTLKSNPYLGYKADMDFYLCDALAYNEKFDSIDPKRIKAIIYTAFNEMQASGNTNDILSTFLKRIYNIERKSIYQEHISYVYYMTILNKMKDVLLFQKDEDIYITTKELYHCEKNIVEHFKRLYNSKKKIDFNENDILEIEQKENIKYGESQKNAFQVLKETGIKVITGGPGTGKTTVIKGLAQLIHKLYPKESILFLAPTGRAAQRIKESAGYVAYTIHKGIDFRPFGEEQMAKYNRDNPLENKFIFVDETSMIDVFLLSMLLDAVQNGSLIIFLGDVDQLPSVGAGNVLYDLINIPIVDVFRLTDCYRQQKNSGIQENIQKIKQDDILLQEREDFHIIRSHEIKDLENKVLELFQKKYDKEHPNNLQILSPIKKHHGGINSLNSQMQKMLPLDTTSSCYDRVKFHKGDKIIFTRTNYDKGYYNGDIGIIENIIEDKFSININGCYIDIDKSDLRNMSLGYVITIHKSQGSEFPVCAIILPKAVLSMLDHNLLFTAITRAKQEVYIFSEDDALEIAIKNHIMCNRKSNIQNIFNQNITILSKNAA